MSSDPVSTPPGKRLAAMVPGRLAVSEVTVDLPASMHSERHQAVRDCALEWQRFSSEAWFWEMASPEAVENAAYALAGQMASVGEQVALAYSAAVEVALWQTKPAVEEDSVVREMSIRAMAEAQSLFVIGAGHALANVAVRALTVRADLKARLAALFQPKAADGFAPFSQKREDWISLNTLACKKLAAAAATSKSRDIIALVAAVVNYGNWGLLWCDLLSTAHALLAARHGSGALRGQRGRSVASLWRATRSTAMSADRLLAPSCIREAGRCA
jgi:hypothetical protein